MIVQCDIQKNSFIAAFDVATGQPAWRTAREEIPSWSTPAIFENDGRAELVTQATTFIRGYDPENGKELWRLGGNSEITIPTPIVGPGVIIVTNGYRGVQPIFAIKPGAPGDITLKGDRDDATSSSRGARIAADPTSRRRSSTAICSTCLPINGVLAAYDVRNRAARLPGAGRPAADRSARRRSPPTARLYLTSEDGDVFVVKAGPTLTSCSRPTRWAR